MAHKTRAEQRAFKVRKDPKKLAKRTKPHMPKDTYTRKGRSAMEYLYDDSFN